MDSESTNDEKQCRICLDGVDAEPELGKLIKPCLCRGSISYVHVKCLQQWRTVSASHSAFFICPQCKYSYRFSRASVLGIGTNPVVIGAISTIIFTALTLLSSYVTTYFMSALTEVDSASQPYSLFFVSPIEVASDLVRAAVRIMQDSDEISGVLDDAMQKPSQVPRANPGATMPTPRPAPGFLRRFIARIIIGLPLIGASSLVQMFLTLPFMHPLQWIAQYRGQRRRHRNGSKDIAALIIVALLVLGSVRALYKVYQFTQNLTKRLLLRAENAILEVN